MKPVDTSLPTQDHLELLFSKVRQKGGWCTNPTPKMFKAALRSIMMSKFITPSEKGNCSNLVEEVTDVSFNFCRTKKLEVIDDDELVEEESQEELAVAEEQIVRQLSFLDSHQSSDWRANVMFYCAGFVARRIQRKITCDVCLGAVSFSDGDDPSQILALPVARFFQRKNNGGLILPSVSTYIIQACDIAFRVLCPGVDKTNVLPYMKNLDTKLRLVVMNTVDLQSLFPEIHEHLFFDCDPSSEPNHLSLLLHVIISAFVKLRLITYGKRFFVKKLFDLQSKSRQQANKLILFEGK